ncbi:transmembrane protein 177 [Denticeps clupeoides]|uniref:transmembrane protein 177 n=1 Tax=Denticeps clupeoides TaxID=299321 RepID=UPI0010A3D7FA|nr:transmembrane protein 177 [Denticeps clupeoides]
MAPPFLKLSAFLQKNRRSLLLLGCGGAFSASIFYHAFPDSTYKNLYQAWSKGEPAQLSGKLEETFREVLKDCGVASPKNYHAFASFGFHPVGAGLPWLPAGVHIGIPANFNSTSSDPGGITDRTVLINGKEVEWDSEAGAALKEALLFSPEAQRFALAREVMRLESGGPVLQATAGPACLAGVCVYSVALKQIFGLYSGSLIARAFLNVLVAGLGAVCYFLASDSISHWLDYSSDRRAAGLSRDYARGGVEFYDKILSRNKTLRLLMGPKGVEMYAPSGNLFPSGLLRFKHAPYTLRREELAALLEEEKA